MNNLWQYLVDTQKDQPLDYYTGYPRSQPLEQPQQVEDMSVTTTVKPDGTRTEKRAYRKQPPKQNGDAKAKITALPTELKNQGPMTIHHNIPYGTSGQLDTTTGNFYDATPAPQPPGALLQYGQQGLPPTVLPQPQVQNPWQAIPRR